MLVSWTSLMTALKSKLEGLEISAGVPAFESVTPYKEANLIKALQDLRVYRSRVCLIIPAGSDYQSQILGRVMVTQCLRSVILLISDRDFAQPNAAALGDANTRGVLALSEVVIDQLTGNSLGLDGVRIRPIGEDPVVITEKERPQAPGRADWQIELEISAGWIKSAAQ